MEALHTALEDRGLEYVRNLEKQFDRAAASIEWEIDIWYQRFADNNAISYADARKWLTAGELEEFRWTVEDYIRHGEENALSGQWVKQLENASARVHVSRLDALKLQLQQQAELLHGGQLDGLDTLLRRTYTDGFYRTAFELQRGIGTGWTLHSIDNGVIDKALARPWTADGQTFSGRIWANRDALVRSVNTHLTQAVIRGGGARGAIDAVARDMRVAKHKAARLVMTESAALSSAAQKDCFDELVVERYVIVATLDAQTSEICRDLDGKVFKMSEYAVGLTAPPFHPWCRTCNAPYFEDMAGLGERASRDPVTGKTVTDVPRDMKYPEWKEKFVDTYGGKAYNEGVGGGKVDTLPRYEQAVIPIEKLTKYALDPMNSRGKWFAFQEALGYNLDNADMLLSNIKQNIMNYPAEQKGDKGYGQTYAVLMELTGANNRTANVMTAWLDDKNTGEMRLTSLYVKKRKGGLRD